MLYHLYDLSHAALTPLRFGADMTKTLINTPGSPLAHTAFGRSLAAGAEVFERATRRFGKPIFGLDKTSIDGKKVSVEERIILEKPFCNLLNFRRKVKRDDPKVLIVSPMSGHFATLLRGTVEALIPHHDVYITDWIDARQVPYNEGKFDLDDYIAYVIEFLQLLGPDTHVVAVCQPAPAVLAAISLMAGWDDPNQPLTMTLMGGPIDTRISKTEVTKLAEDRPLEWFKESVVTEVPFYYPGAFRRVYPGFLQLSGFMSMNLDRHVGSSMKFFEHLIVGDGESAQKHRTFYNEYLAVMDITAEFYLQTVKVVFQDHLLPDGKMKWKDPKTDQIHDVDTTKIKHTALLTIEGELDDISAMGQTFAAHDITPNLPEKKHHCWMQKDVGHYGIFNGSKWRAQIMPRLRHFMRQYDKGRTPVPSNDLKKTGNLKADSWCQDDFCLTELKKRYNIPVQE